MVKIIQTIKEYLFRIPAVRIFFNNHPVFKEFIKRRLTPDEELGLHLTVGAVITAFFVLVFFKIARDLVREGELGAYDSSLGAMAASLRSAPLDGIFLFITYLGEWQVIVAGVIAASMILALKGYRRYAAVVWVSVVGGELFIWLAKHLVGRPRPDSLRALIEESGFSFPSGHTFIAVSFYGLLAYFLFRAAKANLTKVLIIAIGTIVVALIGFSRLYLGVHWPSDVLASFASGAAWLTALVTTLEHQRKFHPYDPKPYWHKKKIFLASGFLVILWIICLMYVFYTNPFEARLV